MFNGFFGVEHVDGVYWSLVIELKFYILIGIILFFRLIKFIRIFAWLLLVVSICQIILPYMESPYFLKVIYFLGFPDYSPYFVTGMFFFFMKTDKNIIKNLLPILISYGVAIKLAFESVDRLNEKYFNAFDINIVVSIITVFFIIMFLVCINKLNSFNKKIFLYFGVLTYPLYLIHQTIGYIIFNNLSEYINKWLLISLLIIIMLCASYLINKYIEKPLGNYMRTQLRNNKLLNKLKLKFIL